MNTKLLSLLAALLVPIGLQAEIITGFCGAEGENISYTFDTESGELTLAGSGRMANYNQASYNNRSPWGNDGLQRVVVGEGITHLGDDAFCYELGSKLVSVELPSTLVAIGNGSFEDCEQLAAIALPAGLKRIGDNAFNGCTALAEVTLPDGLDYIGNSAFNGCSAITAVRIPEGVDSLQNYAFQRCSKLAEVILPSRLTYIGYSALAGCTALKHIDLPASLREIESGAFQYSELEDIDIPDGVVRIGEGILHGTQLSEPVYTSTHFVFLPWRAYQNSNEPQSYYSYTVPEGITHICGGAIDPVENRLTTIVLPSSLTTLDPSAFANATALEYLTLPPSVTDIGEGAFVGCTALQDLDIPAGVTEIKANTFYGCTSLQSIWLPEHITRVGSWAFYGCASLRSISLPQAEYLGYGAFQGCSSLTTLEIPNVTEAGIDVFDGCTKLSGPLYTQKLFLFMNSAYQGDYTVPEGIEAINHSAFKNCTGLTGITLPSSLRAIGQDAFYGCKALTEVSLPETTDSIGNQVFYGCRALTSATLSGNLRNIPLNAFSNCSALQAIYIPGSVREIGSAAFLNCTMLAEVHMAEGVETIMGYVFRNCTALTRISLPASVRKFYESSFEDCEALEGVDVDPDNSAYASLHGAVFNKQLTELVFVPRGIAAIEIPATFEGTLPRQFLADFPRLRELSLPFIGASRDTTEVPATLFSWLFPYTTRSSGSYPSTSRTVTYTPTIPETLKKLVFTGDTLDMARFSLQEATEDGGYVTYYNKYEAPDLSGIDTLLITGAKAIAGTLGEHFAPSEVHIAFQEGYPGQLEPGVFADLHGLKSLTIPFAGAGTAATAGNFGELFGTAANSRMRAVTQLFQDGSSKTYYLPAELSSLELTEGCEQIAYGGLSNCTMLRQLTLPISLYMVGDQALYACAGLTDIYCKGADPAAAFDGSFEGMRLSSCVLHVPYNASDRYSKSTGWEQFYNIQEEAPISIAVFKNIENGGVIYGPTQCAEGQEVRLEAVANYGYTFYGWADEYGTIVATSDIYTFTATENQLLLAMFIPVSGSNTVEATPEGDRVIFTWEAEEGADSYLLTIYSDEAMTQSVRSMRLDAQGNPIKKTTTERLSATLDGLEGNSNYYYSINALSTEGRLLSLYTGSFSTLATGIENATAQETAIKCSTRPGSISIEGAEGKDIAVSDMQGRLIHAGQAADAEVRIACTPGTYLIRVEQETFKVVVP